MLKLRDRRMRKEAPADSSSAPVREQPAYNASGASTTRVPATSGPPENLVMKLLEVIAIYAATGIVVPSSPKYTSSGVWCSRD